MKIPTDSKGSCKHKWRGVFLDGRIKVTARFENHGKNMVREWDPMPPWEAKMTRKTWSQFQREYHLFRWEIARDLCELAGKLDVFMAVTKGKI
ncbi:MAG: hypothetical protein O3C43_06375 [Verrucomicrobia bacterium]|nr:hypothetical protein [Verrucomicrobiota bacterium]MDA1066112.1 hypothetical protein [Verrucomicrobiota bacterium]